MPVCSSQILLRTTKPKRIQTCLARSCFSYVIKSFHFWFQSRMHHCGAGLTGFYLHCFTGAATQVPANTAVTWVTSFCIVPQHNTQHTFKTFSEVFTSTIQQLTLSQKENKCTAFDYSNYIWVQVGLKHLNNSKIRTATGQFCQGLVWSRTAFTISV